MSRDSDRAPSAEGGADRSGPELATALADRLNAEPPAHLLKAEVIGGFVNLRLDDGWLPDVLQAVVAQAAAPPEDGYHGAYVSDWAFEMPDDADPTEWGRAKALAFQRDTLAAMGVSFETWTSERELVASGAVEAAIEFTDAHYGMRFSVHPMNCPIMKMVGMPPAQLRRKTGDIQIPPATAGGNPNL